MFQLLPNWYSPVQFAAAPGGPGNPLLPRLPWGPGGPDIPFFTCPGGPWGPVGPGGPEGPGLPFLPRPGGPWGPVCPGGPGGPGGPWGTTRPDEINTRVHVGSKLNVARPSSMKSHEDCLLRSYIFTKNGMHVCDLFVYVFKPERLVCTSSGRRRRWKKSCTTMLRTLKSFLHFLKPNDTNNCQK